MVLQTVSLPQRQPAPRLGRREGAVASHFPPGLVKGLWYIAGEAGLEARKLLLRLWLLDQLLLALLAPCL